MGLGETEFVLSTAILLAAGALLGLASDRISQRTNKTLLRRGFVACVAAFALIHLPLRLLARCATERWLGMSLPDYLVKEMRRAWMESAPAA